MRARRLKIRGQNWRIVVGRPPRNECDALCDYDSHTIFIRKGANKAECITHEILHACFPDLCEEAIEEAEVAIVKGLELVA